MPELLLELFSEEIPARMQRQAADDLRRLVTDGLVAAGLTYEGAKAFVTPRRLALTVQGVTARSADVREERKGPRVGAPAKAIEGFLRAAGLGSIEQAEIQSDPKKGDFYVATITKPGRPTETIVAELIPEVIRAFPWPKSMRWGARSAPADSPYSDADGEGATALRWIRPLRSILCTFGPETEEPTVVPIAIAGIAAGDVTYGHRFLSGPEPIRVRRFNDYAPALQAAKVVLDSERRAAIIETEAKNLAFAQGLELVEDAALVAETAGLVEWPVVLMGRFDEAFLAIPDEVIRLTIRQNQKCFVLRNSAKLSPAAPRNQRDAAGLISPPSPATGEGDHAQHGGGGGHEPQRVRSPPPPRSAVPLPRFAGEEPSGRLTNRFILVSNLEASDGGGAIVAGNERVIAARLSDARFFWEQDQATPLADWAKKLATVTFHEKLGSQAERVERIARLARELAPLLIPDASAEEKAQLADDAEAAARLAKADLTTGMVGEFPELQGVMGRYYFLAQHGLYPSSFERHPRALRGDAPQDEGEGEAAPIAPHLEARAKRASKDEGQPVRGYGSRTGAAAPAGITTGQGAPDEPRLRAIADAIRDHYKPQGPADSVPTDPISVAVALADKLDTLTLFFWMGEPPTRSKDPYGLRRAAIGIIRLVLGNEVRLSLSRFPAQVVWNFLFEWDNNYRSVHLVSDLVDDPHGEVGEDDQPLRGRYFHHGRSPRGLDAFAPSEPYKGIALSRGDEQGVEGFEREEFFEGRTGFRYPHEVTEHLLAFFADRLKVHLRETGARHDLIDAVFAAGAARPRPTSPLWGEAESRQRPGEGAESADLASAAPSPGSALRADSTSPQRGEEKANDDLLMIVRRVEALGKFLDTDDGANLLIGYRRAANIVRAEEKRDGEGAFDAPPDPALIAAPEEHALYQAMQVAESTAREAVGREDFAAAMTALAALRPAVDGFFDHVTVNAEDPAVRANRLKLLNMLRRATLAVADFSKIAG